MDDKSEKTLLIKSGINDTYLAEQQQQQKTSSFPFWKDLLCLSFSFMLIFTGFMALQNMESSLNKTVGLGVGTLACMYGGILIAGTISPMITHLLGFKWSIILCFIAQVLFAASNIYSSFFTLIPCSLILGVLSAALWTGQGSYITILADDFAKFKGLDKNQIISMFNGIFFLIFQSSQISGNLISSLVLTDGSITVLDGMEGCGFNFCDMGYIKKGNITTYEMVKPPPENLVFILIGIFLFLDVIAIILSSCFLSNRTHGQEGYIRTTKESALCVVKLHRDKRILLLLPWFVYNGMEQGFIVGEYTKAFPGCSMGMETIGYVMISFGTTTSIFSFVAGRAEKIVGRMFLFTLAVAVNVSMLVTMIFWSPESGSDFIFYVIPGFWGIANAIWQCTTSAFLGVVFIDNLEPAFAILRMWMAVGFVILMTISHFICMDVKIYLTMGMGVGSMLLYYIVEANERRSHSKVINTVRTVA